MADVEIRGKISVDTGNTQKSVNEMLESIKQTKAALKDAKVGSEEYKAAQAQLKKQTDDLNKTMDQSSGSFSKLKGTLGQVVPGLDAASEGAAGFGKQLWLLVANPIVAIIAGIVAALTLLYKAFASTNDGADKLEQIFAGVGAAVEVLRDRVLAVAGAIGKFFSGDFKAALEDGKKAVSGIGQEIADEFSAAAQATKTLQDLEDAMRGISVNRAKLNHDLAQAKEIMNNADATFAERQAALNKVREAEKKQTADELKAAETKYKALKADVERTKRTNDDKLNALAAAEAEMYNLQASSASQIRSLNRMENTLRREASQKAAAEQKAIDDAKKKKEDDERASNKKKMQDDLSEAALMNQTLSDLSALDAADKKKRDEEKDALAQKEIERASFAADMRVYEYETNKRISDEEVLLRRNQQAEIANILGNAMNVFGRQTIAGKSLAVANALINTYSGATDALRAKSTLPSPFDVIAKVANVATVLATGFKSVKAINSVQIPGGGGGSFSMPTMNASAPLAPQQSSTSLNAGSIQGVGNAAAGGVGRSFVLDADIKSNQERQSRIARAARLG